MNRFTIIVGIVTIITGLAGVYGTFFTDNIVPTNTKNITVIVKKEKPIPESKILLIKTIAIQRLTNIYDIDGIKSTYNNKPIGNSLWRLEYNISNIGTKAIMGIGDNKDLIYNSIIFNIETNFEIFELYNLDSNMESESHFQVKEKDNSTISVSFIQWKPNQTLRLLIYANRKSSSKYYDEFEEQSFAFGERHDTSYMLHTDSNIPNFNIFEQGLIDIKTNYIDLPNQQDKKK